MGLEEMVERSKKDAENSRKVLLALKETIREQDNELDFIQMELKALGINPDCLQTLPPEMMSANFPPELSGVAHELKEIVRELERSAVSVSPIIPRSKVFNPMNKFRML